MNNRNKLEDEPPSAPAPAASDARSELGASGKGSGALVALGRALPVDERSRAADAPGEWIAGGDGAAIGARSRSHANSRLAGCGSTGGRVVGAMTDAAFGEIGAAAKPAWVADPLAEVSVDPDSFAGGAMEVAAPECRGVGVAAGAAESAAARAGGVAEAARVEVARGSTVRATAATVRSTGANVFDTACVTGAAV